MIEVRLFATLREGRGKIVMLEPENFPDAGSVISVFGCHAWTILFHWR